MNKSIISIILLLFSCVMIQGQELFTPLDRMSRSSVDLDIHSYLEAVPTIDYYLGTFHKESVLSDRIYLTVPGENMTLEYICDSYDEQSWSGTTADKTGSLIVIIKEDHFVGWATHNEEVYDLRPVNPEVALMAKVDQLQYNEFTCDVLDKEPKIAVINPQPTGSGMLALRVLVAYTPAAASKIAARYSTIVSDVQLACSLANQSYRNSGVYQTIELAACVAVNYKEEQNSDGVQTDLSRFMGKNDGYMDEIHTLRDLYKADVCVLVEDPYDSRVGGLAAAILANENTAFCVVGQSALTYNYSFAHEIGHLHGARHDRLSDNTMNPAHAHGYLSPNSNWRTVMAYPTYCNNCVRVNYWSNPNVRYPSDNLPMGTTTYENNALVMNTNMNLLNSFRSDYYGGVVRNLTLKNNEWGSLSYVTSLEIADNVVVKSGGELLVTGIGAGGPVILSPGFRAEAGSKVSIFPALLARSANEEISFRAPSTDEENEKSLVRIDLNVYPNPGNNFIVLESNDAIEKAVLFDETGGVMLETIVNDFRKELDVSHLPGGVYLLNIYVKDQVESRKIFLSK